MDRLLPKAASLLPKVIRCLFYIKYGTAKVKPPFKGDTLY